MQRPTPTSKETEALMLSAKGWILEQLSLPENSNLITRLKSFNGSPGKIVKKSDEFYYQNPPYLPQLATREEYDKRREETFAELLILPDSEYEQYRKIIDDCETAYLDRMGYWSGSIAMQIQWLVFHEIRDKPD